MAALADELYLSEDFLDRIVRLIEDKGQVVCYGPPGTGKTFVARKLAGHIARGGGTVEKVQFHPSYAYEDFIEGYRPKLVDGRSPTRSSGPLKRIAATAQQRPDLTHVLLIDELNRANVAKVLGELLFALEYRDEEIRLQYSDAPFALPPNLRIIATMNTADRSVALVDMALRRRFHFVPFFPDNTPIDTLLRRWLADRHPELGWVADVVGRVNERLDRNIAIGPSHFPKPGLSEELVRLIWESSPAVSLARLIVTTAGLESRAGGEDASAFVVDMNAVFERFVRAALREELRLDATAFPAASSGHTVYLDNRRFVRLEPDLSWWDAGRCVFAGDCKYKRPVGTVPNADIYQMLAYLTALQLPEGLLIYAAGENVPPDLVIEHAGKRVHTRPLDVSRPPAQLMHDVRSLARLVRELAATAPAAAGPQRR